MAPFLRSHHVSVPSSGCAARAPCALVSSPRIALVAAALLVAPSAGAQSFPLSGPLERENGGGVRNVLTTPDGAWVVYEATEDSQAPGLYSAPIDGSRPSVRLLPAEFSPASVRQVSTHLVVLSAPQGVFVVPVEGGRAPAPLLPPMPGRSIDRVRLSPDETRVVYSAATPSSGGWHLFSADIGGEALELGGPVPANLDFLLTPDGQRVVYVADQETAGVHELFSALVAGGAAAVKLNGPLGPQGDVRHGYPAFRLSPGGARVVYAADPDVDELFELFSAPVDGSASPVELSGATGIVREFQITSDESRVVFSAAPALGKADLYVVPIDGSAGPVKVNGVFDDVIGFQVGPGGHHVVFRAGGFQNRHSYSVPLRGGSAPFRLPFGPLDSIEFSPDGGRIVYSINRSGRIDLCSLSLQRRQWIELTGFGAGQALSGYQITPRDSVVYLELHNGLLELREVPLLGGAPLVLAAFPPGVSVTWIGPTGQLRSSPDGRHLLYLSDAHVDQAYELFSLALERLPPGAEPVRLNGALVTDHVIADVTAFQTSSDGASAAFTLHAPGPHDPGHGQLFGVPLDRRAGPVELFRQASGLVSLQAIAAHGDVVFKAGDIDVGLDLYSVPIDGAFPAVQLNDPGTSRSGIGAVVLSPNGEWVVFNAYQGEEGSELYGVATGGGAELELSGELVEGGSVRSFQVTPDGARVVYVADQLVADVYELFSVPIEGGAGPVRLNAPLVAGGDVALEYEAPSFQLAPDGGTVVYLADQEHNGVFELYAAPVDGSAPAWKLSGVLPAASDVLGGFRLDSGGEFVVYRADALTDETFELWFAPLDGSGPPTRASGALVPGGDVQPWFELTPDGARVVYLADALADEVFELFCVALDGASPPTRLSGVLVAGGDVPFDARFAGEPYRPFVISPDGRRVVYRADARADEVFELFSVPIEGGTALLVSGALGAAGDVLDGFRIAPDSASVVYGADQDDDGVFELYVAPLERDKAARKLNSPLVPGGDAALVPGNWGAGERPRAQFELTARGRSVVYVSDQVADEVFELYLSDLGRPFRLPSPVPSLPRDP